MMQNAVHKITGLIVALLSIGIAFSAGPAQASQKLSNISVKAVYLVEFGGVDLGKFSLKSKIENDAYTMNGATKLSILGGTVMKWKMFMNSRGKITNEGVVPEEFSYNFRNKRKKKKKLKLVFPQSPEEKFIVEPTQRKSKKYVPLKPEHLRDVYDPMSALMLMTHASSSKMDRRICNRTIRLFDGKEHYNIAFKYKRIKMVRLGDNTGKRTKAYICSLRYIPVAGHKRKDKTKKYMAKVKGIEVWFTPLKLQKSGIYVPHTIKIPTPFGTTTTISASYFGVQNGKGSKIHFIK